MQALAFFELWLSAAGKALKLMTLMKNVQPGQILLRSWAPFFHTSRMDKRLFAASLVLARLLIFCISVVSSIVHAQLVPHLQLDAPELIFVHPTPRYDTGLLLESTTPELIRAFQQAGLPYNVLIDDPRQFPGDNQRLPESARQSIEVQRARWRVWASRPRYYFDVPEEHRHYSAGGEHGIRLKGNHVAIAGIYLDQCLCAALGSLMANSSADPLYIDLVTDATVSGRLRSEYLPIVRDRLPQDQWLSSIQKTLPAMWTEFTVSNAGKDAAFFETNRAAFERFSAERLAIAPLASASTSSLMRNAWWDVPAPRYYSNVTVQQIIDFFGEEEALRWLIGDVDWPYLQRCIRSVNVVAQASSSVIQVNGGAGRRVVYRLLKTSDLAHELFARSARASSRTGASCAGAVGTR